MPADRIQEQSSPKSIPLGYTERTNADGSKYYALQVDAGLGNGAGDGGDAIDREIVLSQYRVKTAFTDAAVGDIVSAVRVLDLKTDPISQVGPTLWYNETKQLTLSAPSSANLEPSTSGGLTNAQFVAAIVGLATAAKQDLMQTVLASVDSKLPPLDGARLPVSLPSGLATSAGQVALGQAIDALSTIMTAINGKTPAAGAAQPISATSLPLPTGAATSALQTAGNTSLSSLDTKLPGKGTTTAANALPVTPASDANVARESYGSAPIWNPVTPVTAGTYVSLPAQLCNNVMLVNPSTVDLEFQIGGTGGRMALLAGMGYMVPGVTNANQIGVRRRDAATAAQVAVEFCAQAMVL